MDYPEIRFETAPFPTKFTRRTRHEQEFEECDFPVCITFH